MIPKKLLTEILADPYYEVCARLGDDCDGRITFEHVFTVAGRSLQEKWAIIPLCEFHHSLGKYLTKGGGLNKKENRCIAFARATNADLKKYPKVVWHY